MTTIHTVPERCMMCGGLGQVYYSGLKKFDDCTECDGSGEDRDFKHDKRLKKNEQLKMFENDNET